MNASLSLAIIAKNVEVTVDKCLSTFQPCVDEIVFVDTGSTDGTLNIAKKYTDNIYHFEWIDDFSAARNFCFEKCTKDFIFWNDADDYILPENVKKVQELDYSNKEIVICQYYYLINEYGHPVSIVHRERIIKRSLGLKWEQPIHEYIPLRGNIHVADIITHHQKQHSTSERNIEILKKSIEKNPADSRSYYYLGKELLDMGKADEGQEYLLKSIERGDGFWEDIYSAHYRLAEIYLEKDEAKFKHHLFESIKIEERRAEPYYLMAQYWERKQQIDRAIQWYDFCTQIHRPKGLFSPYRPEFSTWKPYLQMCVCYNSLGDIYQANECNKKALEYLPKDNRILKNKEILERALERRKKDQQKDGQGQRLNLGCGGKAEVGYINVDLFDGPAVDEIFDLDEIPYKDNTISRINSEHSLEHVGWLRADKALNEWYRVLMPGGQLMLKIPDFEDCCRKYIETPVDNDKHRQWYKYTVYGVQKTQAGEPDEAQYHRAGWSTEEMCKKLESIGFIIDFSQRYNGWDTPSTGILAVKPMCNIKVGWIAPNNWEAAQTRIRVLNVNRWLRSKGYQSSLATFPDILDKKYTACIVGKSFDKESYEFISKIKEMGIYILCDLCEDILWCDWVKPILEICDVVICCSSELAKKVQNINMNTIVIEDAYET